jgi:prepilin-type N-terminal cleavage/methylation domain-containing protein
MGIVSEHPTSARSAGFTFLEVVIAMVIVAILGSAVARFVDFDAANKAAAELGYQGVETRWKAIQVEKISDTVSSKSTALPSIAELSGYVEASTAEEAPDELPVLYSYSYWMLVPYDPRETSTVFSTDLLGYRPLTSPPFGTGINWQDPNGDGVSSCEELASGMADPRFVKIQLSSYAYVTEMSVQRTADDLQVPHTNPVPGCLVRSISYRRWCTMGATCQNVESDVPPAAANLGFSKTQNVVQTYDTDRSYNRRLSPSFYRYSCKGHSDRYGVEYALPANMSLDAPRQLNITRTRVSDDPIYYEQSYNPVYPPAPITNAKCVRQGPAPAVPPATDGNPGNPPPKADFSGLCVAKGWSVATFKPDGTPTSSATDPVARIASPTEDASCD